MRAAVYRVDAVGERVDELGEAVVVLHRHLDDGVVNLLLRVNGIGMYDGALLIQAADEAGNTALEVVSYFVVRPEVFVAVPVAAECDFQALVQVRHLLEALAQHIEVIGNVLEYLDVRRERHRRARLAAAATRQRLRRQLRLSPTARESLPVQSSVSANLDLKALRERVDHRCAHAVQPAGYSVSLAAELAARVQRGHHRLHGGHAGRGVNINRNASSVVFDTNDAIRLDVYGHPC